MTELRDAFKIVLRRGLPAKWYLQLVFRIKFGRWIDFKQPKTLNEKLQWSKLYGYQDIFTLISDKYRVRQYVAGKVGEKYLIPLYAVLHSENDFDLDRLPGSFVAKPTHSSGEVLIINDRSALEEQKLRPKFRKWLKINHYKRSLEPQYKHIEPGILIEKLLLDKDGKIPIDYKFHCFSGKVEMIQVDIDRFEDHRRNFYSTRWERLPFNWTPADKHKRPIYRGGPDVKPPESLDEMVWLAEKLARDFGYIRVDLYHCQGTIYFGELTLCHGSGFEPFFPDECDFYYGDFCKNKCFNLKVKDVLDNLINRNMAT